MKQYQFYGILTAIWSCGVLGATTTFGAVGCAALAVLNLGLMLLSKDN